LEFSTGFVFSFALELVRSHDVDRGCIQPGFDVCRVIFFGHLDAGPAVLGDLVYVGAFLGRL
jgi:hypothetical protein